jgi:recombination protein RecA
MSELKEQLKEINKKLGVGTIGEMSSFGDIKVRRTPTGSFSLDYVMGGGLPQGRIIEIFGEPSSGKTVMSLFMIKEVQKRGGIAAYIDCENAFSIDFAKNIGVDTEKLIFSQAVVAEEVLDIVERLIQTKECGIIVVDSVASMVPKKELEGEIGDAQVALMARIMSQALRMITGKAASTHTAIVFVNQIRQKVGIQFGNPNTTSGGNALKFYASLRLEVKKGEKLKDKAGEIIGNVVKIEAVKNKTAPPFRQTEFELFYNSGIDQIGDTIDFALKQNIIVRTGNSYAYGEAKMGMGRDQTKKYLEEHPDVFKQIQEQIKI